MVQISLPGYYPHGCILFCANNIANKIKICFTAKKCGGIFRICFNFFQKSALCPLLRSLKEDFVVEC